MRRDKFMVLFTNNFGMKKPNEYDYYDILTYNNNLDIIDATMKLNSVTASEAKAVAESIDEVPALISNFSNALDNINNKIGNPSESDGSTSNGTIMAKLNKSLLQNSDLQLSLANLETSTQNSFQDMQNKVGDIADTLVENGSYASGSSWPGLQLSANLRNTNGILQFQPDSSYSYSTSYRSHTGEGTKKGTWAWAYRAQKLSFTLPVSDVLYSNTSSISGQIEVNDGFTSTSRQYILMLCKPKATDSTHPDTSNIIAQTSGTLPGTSAVHTVTLSNINVALNTEVFFIIGVTTSYWESNDGDYSRTASGIGINYYSDRLPQGSIYGTNLTDLETGPISSKESGLGFTTTVNYQYCKGKAQISASSSQIIQWAQMNLSQSKPTGTSISYRIKSFSGSVLASPSAFPYSLASIAPTNKTLIVEIEFSKTTLNVYPLLSMLTITWTNQGKTPYSWQNKRYYFYNSGQSLYGSGFIVAPYITGLIIDGASVTWPNINYTPFMYRFNSSISWTSTNYVQIILD